MKKVVLALIFTVAVSGSLCHAATVGVGELLLNSPGLGLQSISVSNLTGTSDGCGQLDPSLAVCNAVNFTNWTLTIDFTNEGTGTLPASPLVFNSDGMADDYIGPDQNPISGYSGESANPWSLSLNLSGSNCPPCDAQITEVVFQATLDQTTLQTSSDGSTPYTAFFASPAISADFLVPSSDYASGSPSDAIEIFANSQDIVSTPEPATGLLLLPLAAIGLKRRARIGH